MRVVVHGIQALNYTLIIGVFWVERGTWQREVSLGIEVNVYWLGVDGLMERHFDSNC